MTIRVAVPNKGSLSADAALLLAEAGYKKRSDPKDLNVYDTKNDIEFFYLRPRDIAIYVGLGRLDLGITGRDLVYDSDVAVNERLSLGFAQSHFRFAGPNGQQWDISMLEGKRVATSYPLLVNNYLGSHGIRATIVELDGAVEISVHLGVADVIADVVESGRSLKNNNLAAFGEPICTSEAVLIEQPGLAPDKKREQIISRIQGVVVAQKFVMLDYDCPKNIVEKAVIITPGLESPTISELADSSWVAVRALIPRDEANLLIDQLVELGAKGILVSDIRTCRI